MVIHRLTEGQTVKDVATLYGVDEDILRMNNGLAESDIPAIGEELLVLMPTRTYTVAKGDSIERLALRFGVLRRELLSNNPIIEREGLVPGRRIALKYGERPYGQTSINGYFLQGADRNLIKERMSHLTYVTVGAARCEGKRLARIFDGRDIVGAVKMADKIPLLRILGSGYSELSEDEFEELISAMLNMAISGGYKGISLGGETPPDRLMLRFRKKALGCDLILFCELDSGSLGSASDLADGTVLSFSRPIAEVGKFKSELSRFASEKESNRCMPELCSYAECGGRLLPIDEALRAARRGGYKIEYDSECGVCRFTHKRSGEYVFPSLENIKAILDAIYEYGYMGITFDISSIPSSHLMMISAMFGKR